MDLASIILFSIAPNFSQCEFEAWFRSVVESTIQTELLIGCKYRLVSSQNKRTKITFSDGLLSSENKVNHSARMKTFFLFVKDAFHLYYLKNEWTWVINEIYTLSTKVREYKITKFSVRSTVWQKLIDNFWQISKTNFY